MLLFYAVIFILSSSFNSIDKENGINKILSERASHLIFFIEKIDEKEKNRNNNKKKIKTALEEIIHLRNLNEKMDFLKHTFSMGNDNFKDGFPKFQTINNLIYSLLHLAKKAKNENELSDIFSLAYYIWTFLEKDTVNFEYNNNFKNPLPFLETLNKILKSKVYKKEINQKLLNNVILKIRSTYYCIPGSIQLKPNFFVDKNILPFLYCSNSQVNTNKLIISVLNNLYLPADPHTDYSAFYFISHYGEEMTTPFIKIPLSILEEKFSPHNKNIKSEIYPIKNLASCIRLRNLIIYFKNEYKYQNNDFLKIYTSLIAAGLNRKYSHE